MDLIGELGRAGFDKVVVVLVGGVVIDGVQVGFGKRDTTAISLPSAQSHLP